MELKKKLFMVILIYQKLISLVLQYQLEVL